VRHYVRREPTSAAYELRAVLGDQTRVEEVFGDDRNMPDEIVPLMVHEGAEEWQQADSDAALTAIAIVMNRAVEDEVWAKGHITLTHVKTGRLVREMPAKEES
jgi:hypothetical protein